MMPSRPRKKFVLVSVMDFRHHRGMHTHLPTASKRKTSAIAGVLAFIGIEGSVSFRSISTSISIIRIIKGR